MRRAAIILLLGLGLSLKGWGQEVLEPSVIVATPPLVKTVGDTVVFNPSSLVLEADATLGDLLRKVPGLEIEGATVKLYGRVVRQLLLDGRRYFGGDVLTGLRTLQADAVESISAYDRPSDFARLSGVEDGEEEPVLDIQVKKAWLGRWKGKVQAGGGTSRRYQGEADIHRVTDSTQISIVADVHNTTSPYSARNAQVGRIGAGARGETDDRSAGANYALRRKNLEIEAHAKYDGAWKDQQRRGWSESFHAAGSSFYDSEAASLSDTEKATADAAIEWKPRQNVTLLFKPSLSYSGSSTWSRPVSRTYRTDPLLGAATPLNTTTQQNASYQNRGDGRASIQVTRRFPKKGRSASLRLQGSLGGSSSLNFNDYLVTYPSKPQGIRKQFISAPWMRGEGSLQGSWNEPLGKGFFLQALVSGHYIHHRMHRDFHSMEALGGIAAWSVDPVFCASRQMAALPADYASALDPVLSSAGSYSGCILTAQGSLRYARKQFSATAGVQVKPVWSWVSYATADNPSGSSRSFVCYAAPALTVRYNADKRTNLTLSYRSSVGTPSPNQLVPVRSGTNPMNIRIGNPDLKPSFTHKLEMILRTSDYMKGRSLIFRLEGNFIENAFATSTEYIPETGGRISRTANIGGNGWAAAHLDLTRTFDRAPLTVSNHLDAGFNNGVTYLYQSATKSDVESTKQSWNIRDRADLTARWRNFTSTLYLTGAYTYERYLLRDGLTASPWLVAAGLDIDWRLPSRWFVGADFSTVFSRGYASADLDRDLYMLDLSVSKGVFRGHGIIRLTGRDLLGQTAHVSRLAGAGGTSVTTYNGPGRYVLLQLSWKF